MNVPFVTGDKELDAKFVAEAKAAGFVEPERTSYRWRYASYLSTMLCQSKV